MVPVGFKFFAIAAGGILLGSGLAMHVNPVPREPEPQPWQLTGRAEIVPSDGFQFVEAGPMDLTVPDSYAPDWADDPEVWEYRVPEFAIWEPQPTVAELDAELTDAVEVHYGWTGEADEAAGEAEAVAEQASEALAATDPAPESEPGDTRKPQLAQAGLY